MSSENPSTQFYQFWKCTFLQALFDSDDNLTFRKIKVFDGITVNKPLWLYGFHVLFIRMVMVLGCEI